MATQQQQNCPKAASKEVTINWQSCRFNTCGKPFIKCCAQYSVTGFTGTSYTGTHKRHEPVNELPKTGWAPLALPAQLGGVNPRSVGSPGRGWLPTRVDKYTIPVMQTSANSNHSRECHSSHGRSGRTAIEGGNNRDPADNRQLRVPDFSGRQEGRGPEASNKLEGPQPLCESRTFQDGGPSPPSRPPTTRGLDGQNGPEGCIPTGSHSPRPPTTPNIPLAAEVLQVHLPAIWSISCPEGIHKAAEASRGFPETGGLSPDNIPGRPVDLTSGQVPVTADSSINLPTFREVGSNGQSQEISAGAHSDTRVFGFRDKLSNQQTVNPTGEIEENPAKCTEATSPGISISAGSSPVCGQSDSYPASPANCTPSLQSTAVPDEFCIPRGPPLGGNSCKVQHSSAARSSKQDRPIVVDLPRQELPINPNRPTSPIDNHRVRCIQPGLGSSIEWPNSDGGYLVNTGGAPHQLSRAAGSLLSSPGICQELDGDSNSFQFGQCNSSDIHQSEGRHRLHSAVSVGSQYLDMVHLEGHHHHSRTPPRSPQYDSRPGITYSPRPLRLDVEPRSVSEDPSEAGATGSGLIRISSDETTSPLLQLEGRPRGNSDRCLHAGLVADSELCQPTMVSNSPLPFQGEDAISTNSADNPLLEDPVLVPNSIGGGGGLPPTTAISTRPGYTANGPGFSDEAGGPSTDRLAYLRQSYSSQGLSSEASSLMLASWREKTNSNYGSSFARWAGWCHQRGRDPLSGPIADVVNFLADLFSQGYQYQSLNCFRSAISSAHESVDGVSVGTHPAVARLLKGAFQTRPPMPRYSSFWDVGTVISYLKGLGANDNLTLRCLTLKTVMLLALTRPSRSADLSNLDIHWRSYQTNGVTFRPAQLAKQSRPSRHVADFFFPCFKDDPILCPVLTLKAYEERTKEFRDLQSAKPKSRLFLSWIGQHNPVTSSTIARWLKTTMEDAGIDISIFKSHSVRGATCSKAAGTGVTTKQILEAADWSSEGTFQKFYHRN